MNYEDKNTLNELRKYKEKEDNKEEKYNLKSNYLKIDETEYKISDLKLFEDSLLCRVPDGASASIQGPPQSSELLQTKLGEVVQQSVLRYEALPITLIISRYAAYAKDLPDSINSFYSQFRRENENFHFIDDEVLQTDDFYHFSFRKISDDGNMYTLMFFKPEGKLLYGGQMECINRYSDEWGEVFIQIIKNMEFAE